MYEGASSPYQKPFFLSAFYHGALPRVEGVSLAALLPTCDEDAKHVPAVNTTLYHLFPTLESCCQRSEEPEPGCCKHRVLLLHLRNGKQ